MLSQTADIEAADGQAPAAPVRIAVCGEVRSGKSTVLNTLLRARILPDNLGRNSRPVVRIGHRAETGIAIEHTDGHLSDADAAEDMDLPEDAAQIRLWSDHDHLEGFEFVEIPLTKAEELTEEQVDLVRSCDVMIWVTIGSQAWRLTEKTIVEQFGDARPGHAILAVTRADKLRNDNDRARLKDRMIRETGHLFDACIFVNGAPQQISDAGTCNKAWAQTGAAEISSNLGAFAEDIRARRAGAIAEEAAPQSRVIDLAAYRLDATPAPTGAEQTDEAPTDTPDLVMPDRLETLRAVVADLPGVVVAGLLCESTPAGHEVLAGDADKAGDVSAFCRDMLENAARANRRDDSDDTAASVTLSASEHRFLCQNVPGSGLVYLMASSSLMSHGIAQNALSRLCRALDSDA